MDRPPSLVVMFAFLNGHINSFPLFFFVYFGSNLLLFPSPPFTPHSIGDLLPPLSLSFSKKTLYCGSKLPPPPTVRKLRAPPTPFFFLLVDCPFPPLRMKPFCPLFPKKDLTTFRLVPPSPTGGWGSSEIFPFFKPTFLPHPPQNKNKTPFHAIKFFLPLFSVRKITSGLHFTLNPTLFFSFSSASGFRTCFFLIFPPQLINSSPLLLPNAGKRPSATIVFQEWMGWLFLFSAVVRMPPPFSSCDF